MCEYCSERYNEWIYRNENKCIAVKISDKYSKNNTLRIITGLANATIKINYCPMCGRELGGKTK